MLPLRRVAVLGAGTMGARIAAHFASAGYPVDLLDLTSKAVLDGIEKVKFYSEAARRLIAPGNFDDDLERVRACDWIVEAVAENIEIKRRLWTRVASLRTPGTIVSTNTSG